VAPGFLLEPASSSKRGRQDERTIPAICGRSPVSCVDMIEKKPLHHFLRGVKNVAVSE
jgi:hypothetical protein